MCAGRPRDRSPGGSLILARGQLPPPLHPPDQERCSVDLTRRASPSGLPTGRCFTLRPPDRCFVSGFDQESLGPLHGRPDQGRLRSPSGHPSTSRPPSGPAPGLSRPWTTNRRACRPGAPAQPWADWMRRSAPRRQNHYRAVYGLDGPPWAGAHWGKVLMKGRSGSQKRRTTKRVKVNCTPEHHTALCKLAEAHGQSLSALALNALLNVPLPRAHRPRVDDKLMRQFFVEIARARDALKPSDAELGKAGSNLNQIAS